MKGTHCLEQHKMKSKDDFVNRIICGDCFEIMSQMPDNFVDLVVTSPPYNVGIQYDVWHDYMDWDQYFIWCESWLKELYRIVNPVGGRVCLNHYLSFGNNDRGRVAPLMELHTLSKNAGFKHHSCAVWEDITLSRKTAWGSWKSPNAVYINSPYEGILMLYKDRWDKNQPGRRESYLTDYQFIELARGVWKFGTSRDSRHPATFPESLARNCILLLSFENEIVLDPFVGSGTTCLVAAKYNRQYIGIDISKKYCEMAENEVKNEVAQMKFPFMRDTKGGTE